jgi:hypothetical protein
MKRTACAALFLALVLGALVMGALVVGAPAQAQGQVSGDPIDSRLSQTWYESEGDWAGVWTPLNPRQPTGAYAANWTLHAETAQARLQINISRGGRVTVTRTQPDGQQCRYQGLFNAGGNVVTGTYNCDWHRAALSWRASVGSRIARSASDRPSFDNPQAYLHLEWIEREGNWRGRWTPTHPDNMDGVYIANWTMGSERAHANLAVSVDNTGRVRVNRADPGGRTCNYNGQIGPDLVTITGRYYCSDRPGVQLQWSAVLNIPNRP